MKGMRVTLNMMAELEHHVPSDSFVVLSERPVLVDLVALALASDPSTSGVCIVDYNKPPNLTRLKNLNFKLLFI